MTADILALIIALLFSAFFSAAETAFTSLSDIQIKILQVRFYVRGIIFSYLMNHSSLLLSTILIGNNAANFIFSVISTTLTLKLFNNNALALVTGIMILFTLVFGEITPKQLALQYNQQYISIILVPLYIMFIVLRPIAYVLSIFSKIFFRSLISNDISQISNLSHEHFIKLFYQARSVGMIKSTNVSMITKMLSISALPIDQIITHRTEISSLSSKHSIHQAHQIILELPFSQFPVYEKDDKEHVIGVVYRMDIISHMNFHDSISTIMHAPLFLTEHNSIEEVLQMFRTHTESIAIVLDEYGGLKGLVSVNNIVSYLLNFSNTKITNTSSLTNNTCVKLDKLRYLIEASVNMSTISDIVGVPLNSEIESRTLGGYLQETLGELPDSRQKIDTPYGKMLVAGTKDNRIISVMWHPDEHTIAQLEEVLHKDT